MELRHAAEYDIVLRNNRQKKNCRVSEVEILLHPIGHKPPSQSSLTLMFLLYISVLRIIRPNASTHAVSEQENTSGFSSWYLAAKLSMILKKRVNTTESGHQRARGKWVVQKRMGTRLETEVWAYSRPTYCCFSVHSTIVEDTSFLF